MKKLLILMLLLVSCKKEDTSLINGYVEGEYVYISPKESGILDEIYVKKGDNINVGDLLFSVDKKIFESTVKNAESSLEKAYSNLADLSKGKRKEEIEVILKQKKQAEADYSQAKKEYFRAKDLIKNGFINKTDYDKKEADFNKAYAKVAEIEASLKTAMLSAREDVIKTATTDIQIAKENLNQTIINAENNSPKAKVAGQIEDVYFRLGEMVNKGSPVIAILPPENVKVRFYVSESIISSLKLNQKIEILADGTNTAKSAKISFISSKSEYTPPVIYSIESRKKLVYMIEAVFDNKKENLRPGLPVSIRIK